MNNSNEFCEQISHATMHQRNIETDHKGIALKLALIQKGYSMNLINLLCNEDLKHLEIEEKQNFPLPSNNIPSSS